jgi:hypothetical protein
LNTGAGAQAAYIKQQAVAYAALLLLQPATFSGAAAPRNDAGSRQILALISEDPRQRPFVKTGFLPDLVNHLRQLQLPGYRTVSIAGAKENLAPCVHPVFAAEPSLHQPNDGGGVLPQLIREVSKVAFSCFN